MMAKSDVPEGLITAEGLGRRFDVHMVTIHRWNRQGMLPRVIRLPGKRLLWRIADIEALERGNGRVGGYS